jgi:8-oxo-dGTP diphosphatase
MAEEIVWAASAVIHDSAGRVLLVLRGRAPSRGLWSVPGGRVEPGESLAEAAAREVHEETGLIVQTGRELGRLRIPTGDGRDYEICNFAATVVGGSLCAGDDADDARWVSYEELDSLALTPNLSTYLRGLTLP